MGENNNGIEQPVEPMSRVESILREEDVQRPLSRIEDLLIKGGGGGTTVTISPTLSSGTKIADYTLNGEGGALYAPDGGSDVEANPSGTATDALTKLRVGNDIYSVGGGGASYTEIIDTLDAGDTELILQDAAITTTATYDFFTDTFGVSPTEVEVETGQLTLTFDEQEADISVKVRVS